MAGLRVIDLSTGVAGTRVGGYFADYGADVVWVEPVGGDANREELAVPYAVFNRGKRSVECNLASPEGRAQLDTLLRSADVLVRSWRPGVAERLELDWPALHARFPGLVVCDISGFGPDGPLADQPGFDSLAFAVVGATAEQVGVREPPIYVGLPTASLGAAYLAQIGVLAALHRRHSDGHGRHVTTSLVDGVLAYLSMVWGDSDDAAATPMLKPGGTRLVSRTFQCADGEYVGVHTGAVGAFDRLIGVLGVEAEFEAGAAGANMGSALTPDQVKVMRERLPEIFSSQPREHWVKALVDADVCAIPVLHAGEVLDDPQAHHNEMVVRVEDPVLGTVDQVAPPAKFSASTPVAPRRAPRPGEHTAEVLAEARELTPTAAPKGDPDLRPALSGLKVLDLGAYFAGPFSSRLLADLGAEVIKLESIAGDQLRALARCFRGAQAGKRGLSLNLKHADTRPAVEALVDWADVITHNMRPGAAERLGLGYEEVRRRNPQVIFMHACGWGSTGPRSTQQSFAPLLSGIVGASYESAGRFNEPLFPVANEDPGSGLLGAVAALMALVARDRGGSGQFVDNNQFNGTMAHVAHIVRTADGEVLGAERLDPLQFGVSALDRLYETSDGWISFAVAGPHVVPVLSHLLGRDIAQETNLSTVAARAETDDLLAAQLAEVFRGGTVQKWCAELPAHGAGVVAPATANNCAAYHRDPDNQASGRIAVVRDPELGVIREIAQLVRISETEVAPHRLAPRLGEHTDEILSGLGYTREQVAALRAERAAV